MPSHPSRAAALTVKPATEEEGPSPASNPSISEYLATIGRKGGKKGGKARAAVLSAARRKAIARKAAETRWMKKSESK